MFHNNIALVEMSMVALNLKHIADLTVWNQNLYRIVILILIHDPQSPLIVI